MVADGKLGGAARPARPRDRDITDSKRRGSLRFEVVRRGLSLIFLLYTMLRPFKMQKALRAILTSLRVIGSPDALIGAPGERSERNFKCSSCVRQ